MKGRLLFHHLIPVFFFFYTFQADEMTPPFHTYSPSYVLVIPSILLLATKSDAFFVEFRATRGHDDG